MLKNGDQGAVKGVVEVCQMMVDCLVENMLALDENTGMRELVDRCQKLTVCTPTLCTKEV